MAITNNRQSTIRLGELKKRELEQAKASRREGGGVAFRSVANKKGKDKGGQLKHPKAGEIVGQFPADFKRGPKLRSLSSGTLSAAYQKRQRRSAAAALMSREGISTATRFGAKLSPAGIATAASQKTANSASLEHTAQPQVAPATKAWMSLVAPSAVQSTEGAAPKTPAWMRLADSQRAESKERPLAVEKSIAHLQEQMTAARTTPKRRYASLEQTLRTNDARIHQEAGKIEKHIRSGEQAMRKLAPQGAPSRASLMQSMGSMSKEGLALLGLQQTVQQKAHVMELMSKITSARANMLKRMIQNVPV